MSERIGEGSAQTALNFPDSARPNPDLMSDKKRRQYLNGFAKGLMSRLDHNDEFWAHMGKESERMEVFLPSPDKFNNWARGLYGPEGYKTKFLLGFAEMLGHTHDALLAHIQTHMPATPAATTEAPTEPPADADAERIRTLIRAVQEGPSNSWTYAVWKKPEGDEEEGQFVPRTGEIFPRDPDVILQGTNQVRAFHQQVEAAIAMGGAPLDQSTLDGARRELAGRKALLAIAPGQHLVGNDVLSSPLDNPSSHIPELRDITYLVSRMLIQEGKAKFLDLTY